MKFHGLRSPGRPSGTIKLHFGGREPLGVYRHDTLRPRKTLGVYRHDTLRPRKTRGGYRHDTLRPPIFPTLKNKNFMHSASGGGAGNPLGVYRHDTLRPPFFRLLREGCVKSCGCTAMTRCDLHFLMKKQKIMQACNY